MLESLEHVVQNFQVVLMGTRMDDDIVNVDDDVLDLVEDLFH